MADLLLPSRVRHEIQKSKWEQQRAEQRAIIGRLIDFDDPVCREWAPVLRRVDPHLRLGRARPQAYEPGLNVRPGYYHWVRDNPTAVMTVEPITGPDGESFAEPDSGLLRDLERNDLQNPHVYRALIARQQEREEASEREQAAHMARMDTEVLERWAAGTRTQVSMADVPWTQNAAGRSGKRGQS